MIAPEQHLTTPPPSSEIPAPINFKEKCGNRTVIMAGWIIVCPKCVGSGLIHEPFSQSCPRCLTRGFVLSPVRLAKPPSELGDPGGGVR